MHHASSNYREDRCHEYSENNLYGSSDSNFLRPKGKEEKVQRKESSQGLYSQNFQLYQIIWKSELLPLSVRIFVLFFHASKLYSFIRLFHLIFNLLTTKFLFQFNRCHCHCRCHSSHHRQRPVDQNVHPKHDFLATNCDNSIHSKRFVQHVSYP